ncbi:hypothetical protein HU200_064366 [Digitaria exilis]|uniref:DUF1618 domain-containing protein n=1 Tax=Digitaria exilis TaxID=1010633 RepID=A0A835ABS2_9POAL|nr:hypothetical protein HU200_064366 [Digitaria exilis]
MASHRASTAIPRLLMSSSAASASPRFSSAASPRFSSAASASSRFSSAASASASPRFSSAASASPRFLSPSPRLLGYFHYPGRMRDLAGSLYPTRSEPGVRFEPHAAASAKLSLDFLPGDAADTMVGFPSFLVCDPMSRSHVLLPRMPSAASEDGCLVGAAILSRANYINFEFDAVFITLQGERLRPWIASFQDSKCGWIKLPWSKVTMDFNRLLLEQRCVHATGSMPELTSKPVKTMWLSDIDPGHTERVFIRTTGFGRFSYNLNTGKLDTLKTDDGMVYGDPIFSYFAPTDGEFQ